MAVVVVLFHIHRHDIDLPVAHAALGHDAFAKAAHFGGGAAQQSGFEAVVVVATTELMRHSLRPAARSPSNACGLVTSCTR